MLPLLSYSSVQNLIQRNFNQNQNCILYQPESLPLAMRLVATNLMVLWEAPDDRILATRHALVPRKDKKVML